MAQNNEKLTFGGHLEVLRKMLFRILGVTAIFMCIIFCFKDITFKILLAPSKSDFVFYRWLESLSAFFGFETAFKDFDVKMISTELAGQFLVHLSTTCYLALLCASPYIVYELYKFVAPALYEHEKKYSVKIVLAIYGLFFLGVLLSYYIIFPVSFNFLGTYQIDEGIENQINISSYFSSFASLTFLLGLVFQLPILSFFLAKIGLITSEIMKNYRRHAFMLIMILAAIITPSDLFSLFLVGLPVYGLYELSIRIVKKVEQVKTK
ncbi:MAG: twin-arginine translocase subunit TatC [Bacteroidales bacterium]|nr:twin-arginine translocase subunit TatC [Bacteroidales bacterium]